MSTPQFAISLSGRVSLWCEDRGTDELNRRKFYAINGAYDGCLSPDGRIFAGGDDIGVTAVVSWEGEAPFSHAQYNEAIKWIRTQIGES